MSARPVESYRCGASPSDRGGLSVESDPVRSALADGMGGSAGVRLHHCKICDEDFICVDYLKEHQISENHQGERKSR